MTGWGFFVTGGPSGAWSAGFDRIGLMVLGLLGLTVGWVAVYLVRRLSASGSSSLGDRLAALESRVTDTQEVMIALSESKGSRAFAP